MAPNAERLIGESTDRNIRRVILRAHTPSGIRRYKTEDPAAIERLIFRNAFTHSRESIRRDAELQFEFKSSPRQPTPTLIPISSVVANRSEYGFREF